MSQSTIIDTGVVAVGVSSPVWLQLTEAWMGGALIFGACVLMILRIALAVREWGKK